MRKKLLVSCAAAIALLAIAVVLLRINLDVWRKPAITLWEQITIGSTEAEVRTRLGAPYREHGPNGPANYYEPGYAREERPITGKVLIYRAKDMVFYVWIGRDGKVEYTFYGGS